MIYAVGFQSGKNQQELLQMDQINFPYVCYYRELDTHFNSIVPWHWHKAIEIDYILDGELILTTADGTWLLRKGDLCFINSEVIHSFQNASQKVQCNFYAHLFYAYFLSGQQGSLIEQKYFFPVIGNSAMNACVFSANSNPMSGQTLGSSEKNIREMSALFMEVVQLDQEQPFGFEFEIRNKLGKLWCLLFIETLGLHQGKPAAETDQTRRLKTMLQFIHDNYAQKIQLKDIASAASVSSQECMRCFRKYIHLSPINYLTEYRIRIVAGQLLDSASSITSISENCGFSSNSYFTKVFHQIMGCSPKEYRKKITHS